jgi:hypothetical protein
MREAAASVQGFFTATTAAEVQRRAGSGERVDLPCAVVHPAARPALQRTLGLTPGELEDILAGALGFWGKKRGVIREEAFQERRRKLDFGALTGADALARHAPKLVLRHVPVEAGHAVLREGARLAPPIDAADALYVDLEAHGRTLKRLIELGVPEILVRQARVDIQQIFQDLVSARRGEIADPWQPYADLMTGRPASTLCEPPRALFTGRAADPCVPRDCFVLRSGFLVMFLYASVVIGEDGAIRDVFPTCGLRPVGDHDASILFVCGGGPAASSGYFEPTPIVRDVARRAWVVGALPQGLPRYVAGTIGDVRWAIVADLQRALGYRISPRSNGDQCGGTTTSVDGVWAYDGGYFVVEAATGRRVLDARGGGAEVRSFTRRDDGAWRFVAAEEGAPSSLRIHDEEGRVVRAIPHPAAALSRDGRTLLCASAEEIVLLDVDTGAERIRLDPRPLAAALAIPAGAVSERAWHDLLSTFGVAERVAEQAPAAVRAAFAEGLIFGDVTDSDLATAIGAAADHPRASTVLLPRLSTRSALR